MATEKDTKPFFPLITHQRGIRHRFSAPPPLERGTRVADGQQAACVLNRAASELSEGGDHQSCRDERLESTSTSRPSSSASRISRKFWSAGEYEADGGSSVQPPRSTRPAMLMSYNSFLCWFTCFSPSFFPSLLCVRCAESHVCPPQIPPLQCDLA